MKNIKWGNKELPGVSHDELAKLTVSKMARQQGAETSRNKQTKETLSKGGKNAIKKRKSNKDKWNASVKNFLSAGGKVQGKIQGKKNVEFGHIKALGRKNAEFNNREQTCPHCGKTSRGVGYTRWHGDNCRKKEA